MGKCCREYSNETASRIVNAVSVDTADGSIRYKKMLRPIFGESIVGLGGGYSYYDEVPAEDILYFSQAFCPDTSALITVGIRQSTNTIIVHVIDAVAGEVVAYYDTGVVWPTLFTDGFADPGFWGAGPSLGWADGDPYTYQDGDRLVVVAADHWESPDLFGDAHAYPGAPKYAAQWHFLTVDAVGGITLNRYHVPEKATPYYPGTPALPLPDEYLSQWASDIAPMVTGIFSATGAALTNGYWLMHVSAGEFTSGGFGGSGNLPVWMVAVDPRNGLEMWRRYDYERRDYEPVVTAGGQVSINEFSASHPCIIGVFEYPVYKYVILGNDGVVIAEYDPTLFPTDLTKFDPQYVVRGYSNVSREDATHSIGLDPVLGSNNIDEHAPPFLESVAVRAYDPADTSGGIVYESSFLLDTPDPRPNNVGEDVTLFADPFGDAYSHYDIFARHAGPRTSIDAAVPDRQWVYSHVSGVEFGTNTSVNTTAIMRSCTWVNSEDLAPSNPPNDIRGPAYFISFAIYSDPTGLPGFPPHQAPFPEYTVKVPVGAKVNAMNQPGGKALGYAASSSGIFGWGNTLSPMTGRNIFKAICDLNYVGGGTSPPYGAKSHGISSTWSIYCFGGYQGTDVNGFAFLFTSTIVPLSIGPGSNYAIDIYEAPNDAIANFG